MRKYGVVYIADNYIWDAMVTAKNKKDAEEKIINGCPYYISKIVLKEISRKKYYEWVEQIEEQFKQEEQ